MALFARTWMKTMLSLSLLLCGVSPALAKMPCAEVMEGVKKAGPGKTPDEVATQLGIPVKRVKVCTRKDANAAAAGTAAPAAAAGTAAPAAGAAAPGDDADGDD